MKARARDYKRVKLEDFTKVIKGVLLSPAPDKSLYENKRPSKSDMDQAVKLVPK